MKKINVEVELTNGERHALTSNFNKKAKYNPETLLYEDFNKKIPETFLYEDFNKKILSVLLDRVKESLLETDFLIQNIKSIHFSVSWS